MATSFGSTSTFTFGNMKPAAGEQLDSLWGQNVADNTGFLRAQWMPFLQTYGTNGTTISGTAVSAIATLYYKIPVCRIKGHNRLVANVRGDGTLYASGSPDAYGTHGLIFYGDIGTYSGISGFGTANIGAPYTWGSTYAPELDLDNYLSVGSWGTLAGYFSGTLNDGPTLTLTLAFEFSQMPKVYTTWAN